MVKQMQTTAETAHRLVELAAKRFSVDVARLGVDVDFLEALGIDSVQSLDLLSEVEMAFDVEIPDYELQGVVTFNQLAEKITVRLL